MKIIENFTSDDIEADDTTIAEYVYDADGSPVCKSVVLVKGGALHQTWHATRHGRVRRIENPHPKSFLLPSIDLE
jgi:hypothetical protein